MIYIYSRPLVYTLAILWALFLFNYAAYTIPLEKAALAVLMRWYGFTSLGLLFLALTPGLLRSYFPAFSWNPLFIHARRSIGVSTFFFSLLHALVGFFNNLDGSLSTVFTLPKYYQAGLLLSTLAFGILSIMALTSFDSMVRMLGSTRWKNLHRLVYIAAIFILIHVFLLGSHFTNQDSPIAVFVKWFAGAFIMLELVATARRLGKNPTPRLQFIIILLVLFGVLAIYTVMNLGGQGVFNIHKEHIQHVP